MYENMCFPLFKKLFGATNHRFEHAHKVNIYNLFIPSLEQLTSRLLLVSFCQPEKFNCSASLSKFLSRSNFNVSSLAPGKCDIDDKSKHFQRDGQDATKFHF